MSGRQIDALRHTCGTRKGLAVFAHEDGSIDGYCFACGIPVKYPYGEDKRVGDISLPPRKTEEQIQAEIAEVHSYQTVDVVARKLKADLLNEFGAKTALSEEDGKTPTAIYWPVTNDSVFVGWHVKLLNPSTSFKAFNLGHTKNGDLLNWGNARTSGAYRLIVTEGPEDMASVLRIYQMYGKPEYMPAVVSLPRGAGSAKSALTKHAKEIGQLFKEVVLCFDDDEAGHKAVQDAMLVLPYAKSALLPYKDANECVMKGKSKEAFNALAFRIETPKNTRVIDAYTLHEEASKPAEYGELTWPWGKLQEATRGIRITETGYFGAAPKMGKGEVRDSLVSHFILKDKRKVFVASFEQINKNTYKKILGKMVGKIFHDPKIPFDKKAFDEAGELVKGNLFLLNLYQKADWKNLRQDVITAVDKGCEIIFIDPITNLTNGVNAAEANTQLQDFAQDLSAMALDYKFFAGIFCHLKSSEGNISAEQRAKAYSNQHYIGLGNCSHGWGGNVYSDQFAGSRAMVRSCNFMMGLEGNKDPDLPDEIRNMRNINLLEEREYGEVGRFPIFWDKNTGLFREC